LFYNESYIMHSAPYTPNIDLTGLATLAIAFTSIFALWYQARKQNLSLSADLILKLDDRFYKDKEMLLQRKRAAKSILAGKLDNLDEIFDFFELIALLTKKGALDKEMVWNTFYNPIHYYWEAAGTLIKKIRKETPLIWQDLSGLHDQLVEIEKEKDDKHGEISLTKEGIRDFFTYESQLKIS